MTIVDTRPESRLWVHDTYVHRVGLELEGFFKTETSRRTLAGVAGKIEDDAGLNLGEFITDPVESVEQAVEILHALLQGVDGEVHLVSHRPHSLSHNSGRWQPHKARYTALRQGLQRESPKHWGMVNAMTDRAALQMSFSGAFDPFGEDGVFLINMVNHLAPYLAGVSHEMIGEGYGHLGIWRKFGHPERFPRYQRWLADAEELRSCYESVPKLFWDDGDDVFYQPRPGDYQSISTPSDLGVMWWFMRPKLNPDNCAYLESRYRPSMPLEWAEFFLEQDRKLFELLFVWFHEENDGRPVTSMQAALPAFRFLAEYMPKLVPAEPLSFMQWSRLMLRG